MPLLLFQTVALGVTPKPQQSVLPLPREARLDPTRLVIVTVVDPSNEEVLRDVLTLLRSLRLHGGLLNDATFIACITDPPIEDISTKWQLSKLVYQLAYMGAEISFIRQVAGNLPKTLNKLDALSFALDTFRFDYALWLDADIVVFGDPIARGDLRKHFYPGQIDCVPDFYSYLRRFPHINSTDLVWNPSLPNWYLLGDGDVAPHGTCNTGVLFFDTLTLRRLLDTIPSSIEAINQLNPFKRDRFLDSLYFVSAVNKAGIQAHILSYDLNFMAYFEQEMQEEQVITEDIIFVHFLSNTTMHCELQNGQCACTYFTDIPVPVNSTVVKKVEELLPLSVCHVMAGVQPPPLPAHKQIEAIPRGETEMVVITDISLENGLFFGDSNSGSDSDSGSGTAVQHPTIPTTTTVETDSSAADTHSARHFGAHPTTSSATRSATSTSCSAIRRAALIWPPQGGSVLHFPLPTARVTLPQRMELDIDQSCQFFSTSSTSSSTLSIATSSTPSSAATSRAKGHNTTLTVLTEVWVVPSDGIGAGALSAQFDQTRHHTGGVKVHSQRTQVTVGEQPQGQSQQSQQSQQPQQSQQSHQSQQSQQPQQSKKYQHPEHGGDRPPRTATSAGAGVTVTAATMTDPASCLDVEVGTVDGYQVCTTPHHG